MFKHFFNWTAAASMGLMLVACGETESASESGSNPAQPVVSSKPALKQKQIDEWFLAQVKLVDNLGESRSFCLDIPGGKGIEAVVGEGLQAHTCYDHTKGSLEDQSFDPILIENDKFYVNYFNICMAVESLNQGAGVKLEKCSKSSKQDFNIQSNGNIVSGVRPTYCITVSSTGKNESGSGVTRPLTLEPCSDDLKKYQTWSVFTLKN